MRSLGLTAAQVRAIALDAAGRPSAAAVSARELSLLTLAARIGPIKVIQIEVDVDAWTGVGDYTQAQETVKFPTRGIVTAIGFAEQTSGAVFDQRVQITPTYHNAQPLGFDWNLLERTINAAAFFGIHPRPRDVAYEVMGADDTWQVRFENARQSEVHPILTLEFIPVLRGDLRESTEDAEDE